ncbi:MAG: hypothetical protein KAX87_03090, partial [Nitrospira sp.]|nr:hypothetical protein [Nitrospira sp.]
HIMSQSWQSIAAHILIGLAGTYASICIMWAVLRFFPAPPPPTKEEPDHPIDNLDDLLSGADRLRRKSKDR